METKKFSDQEVNDELEQIKKARGADKDQEPIYKSNTPKTDLNKVLKSD